MSAPTTTPATAPQRPSRGHLIVHGPAACTEPPARARTAPLLAVCGLCGGAGTSTLSHLLARHALAEGSGHVLVADTGGPTGGLAHHAGLDAHRTLLDAADLLARGVPFTAPLYAAAGGPSERELRVLATGPGPHASGNPERLAALLAEVRRPDAHALVIVDCGTLQRPPDRAVLRAASHVAWVLPATRSGADRGRRVLETLPALSGSRELVIARRDSTQSTPPQRALTALAERRRAPLILLPHLAELDRRPERALDTAAVSLQAICGVLSR